MTTPTQSPLRALAKRLRTATEPDRELDAAIMEWAGDQVVFRGRMGWEWRKGGKGIWSELPWPTTSIDAALALVREKLPGCRTVLDDESGPDGDQYGVLIKHWEETRDAPDGKLCWTDGYALTQPIAILSVLLAVLIEQEGGG